MVTINNRVISIQMVTFQKYCFVPFYAVLVKIHCFPCSFTCNILNFKIRPILSFSYSPACSAILKNLVTIHHRPICIWMVHCYAVLLASAYTAILQGQPLFPKCSKSMKQSIWLLCCTSMPCILLSDNQQGTFFQK